MDTDKLASSPWCQWDVTAAVINRDHRSLIASEAKPRTAISGIREADVNSIAAKTLTV